MGSSWTVLVRAVTAVAFVCVGCGDQSPDPVDPPGGYRLELVAGSIAGCGHEDGVGAAARFGRSYDQYFTQALGLVARPDGELIVADRRARTVRSVTADGLVTTLWNDVDPYPWYSNGVTVGTDGTIYAAREEIIVIRPDGSSETLAVPLYHYGANDVVAAPDGSLIVAELGSIYRRTTDGTWTLIAGAQGGIVDGTGQEARFDAITSIALAPSGNLFVVDYNTIRKVTPQGVVTTIAGSPTAGHVDGAGADARFNAPSDIAVDANENLYVVDRGNSTVRLISPAAVVSTLDLGASRPNGVAVNPDGTLSVSDECRILRIDGGTTTVLAGSNPERGHVDAVGSDARFEDIVGLQRVGDTLYVAEMQGWVRVISSDGAVTTLTPTVGYPRDLAAGADGNLLLTEVSHAPIVGRVTHIDTTSGAYSLVLEKPDRMMKGLAVSPNGTVFFGTYYSSSQHSRDFTTSVWRIDAGQAVQLAEGIGDQSQLFGLSGLAEYNDQLFVRSRAQVMTLPPAGGALQPFVDLETLGVSGEGLRVDADGLHFVNENRIESVRDGIVTTSFEVTGGDLGVVLGSSPRVNGMGPFAIDGDTLYFVDGHAVLRLVPND